MVIKLEKQYISTSNNKSRLNLDFLIDNNPQMETAYEIPNCRRFISMDEAGAFINENSWPTKILMICSSVLHECSSEIADAVAEFCKQFVQTLVMRDMSYSTDMFITRELPVTEDELAADPYLQQPYSIIALSADYERFKEHLQKCNEWHLRPEAIIAMWVLKCDYRENWANEVSENYFNNNIIRVARGLCAAGWLMQYNRGYALPYKASQAHFEFKYSLPDTHRQIILTRKETY